MKSLAITPEIQSQLDAAAKTHVDPHAVSVFEAVAVDTDPLHKTGSIYHGARLSNGMLQEMADHVSNGGDVPMHTLHMQGEELPVGKLMSARVENDQLITRFYIPNDRTQLVSDINTGILNSVSVGVKPKQLLCSECGFDYLSPDASFMHIFDQTCANDHVIGQNGVHAKLQGLDRWLELSLVSVGASPKAKIRSRAAARFGAETLQRIAASGIPLEAHLFISNPKAGENSQMDLKEMLARLEAQATEIASLKAGNEALQGLQAQITEAVGKAAELTVKLDALNGELTGEKAKVIEVTAQLAASNEKQGKAIAFLTEHAKRARVATGQKYDDLPTDIEGLTASIEASQKNLVNLFPEGGKAAAAAAGSGDSKPALANLDVFRQPQRR